MSAANNEPVYGHSFQYGLNIGWKAGGTAKINASYILQSEKDNTRFEYSAKAGRIVASSPNAEIQNHVFGVFAGYYPWADDRLGITLGYAGELTQYLEEFSIDSRTALPQVFKNGINLAARYKTGRLSVRTDHNYSFWSDKNYKIYYLYKPDAQLMKDYGLLAESNDSSDVSDVSHSFLWNGVGASWQFTPVIEGSVYGRNLLRTDETPEYKMVISYFSLELRSVFRPGPSVEAYAGVDFFYTGREVSESLPRALGEFGANAPKATRDSVVSVRVPVGVTVKLR
jgi:hypothetical protein